MLILFVNHLLALIGFRLGRATVRPMLPIFNGFGLIGRANIEEFIEIPFNNFVESLRSSQKIVGDIEILQTNTSRAKVVFKAYAFKGEEIVVKWINYSSLFTFQCIGFPQVDMHVHGEIAPYTGGFIPALRFCTRESIAIDYIQGVPLNHYLDKVNDLSALPRILSSIFTGLRSFYSHTLSSEPLNVSLFNSFLIRDHAYMRQVPSAIRFSDLVEFLFMPSGLEELYVRQITSASRIFQDRTSPWLTSLCLRDLSLHNIIYDQSLLKAVLVDVEDAYEGHFVFDLAWLAANIYLTLDPIKAFDVSNDFFKSFIFSLDTVDPLSSLSLYYRLLTSYLIMALLNPTLRDSAQANLDNRRLLRLIDILISL